MSNSLPQEKTPSPFSVEWAKFKILFRRYREHWLNEFFDLSLNGSGYRSRWISTLLIAAAAINLMANALPIYSHLQVLIPALTSGDLSQIDYVKEILFVIALVCYVLIPFYVPKYYAFEAASEYLADVFELKNVGIARTFIDQLSLSGGGQAIHVRNGRIIDEDLNSPIVKIGGPGRVVVEFDSAVLFEKADGTPHVIGPTQKLGDTEDDESETIDVAILDGFERFRESIDLRDHYIGTPSGEGMTIKSLSLDGLPVSATDVRAVYSVRRNESKANKREPSKELPYPYVDKAIEDIVYQATARVTNDIAYPSDMPSAWTSTIQGLIRSAIGEFMSENNLSEYLASVGAPEVELAESEERTIQFQRFEVTADVSATTNPPDIPRPQFKPRTELSGIFSQLSDRFTKRANDKGVDLHWIGVGTWKIPDKIASEMVTEQHIKAWQLNRENISRGSADAIDSIFRDAFADHKLSLIQKVPLGVYKQLDKNENSTRKFIMAYWDLLGEAAEHYYNAGDPLPKELESAIIILETLIFREQHYVNNRPPSKLRAAPEPVAEIRPPAPKTHYEGQLYTRLLRLFEGDYKKAEWLIEYETKKNPGFSSREQVIQYLLEHPELCNL
jgi:hypothetical protein